MAEFNDQIYRHATYSSIKAWRERHGRYRLVGSACRRCEARFFPRRSLCRECGSREMQPYECSPTGAIVVAWSQLGMLRLLGYADLPSRTVAIVRLDDDIFIETEIIGLSGGQSSLNGMRVELAFRKLRRESNGNQCYGYKFTPMADQSGRALNPPGELALEETNSVSPRELAQVSTAI